MSPDSPHVQDLLGRFQAFIEGERRLLATDVGNIFGTLFGDVQRYLTYLELIRSRWNACSGEFTAALQAFQTSVARRSGTLTLTVEQMALLQSQADRSLRCHLEIETFYLISKILLDKLARAVELVFGQARGLSLDSHDQLIRHLPAYLTLKNLEVGERLCALAETLKADVSDVRDYQISHAKNPRVVRGTVSDGSDRTAIVFALLYPKPNEVQPPPTRYVDELFTDLESYLADYMAFVSSNRDRIAMSVPRHMRGPAAES